MLQELDHVVEELEKFAVVHLLQHRSIISLIGNVQRSSLILEKVRVPDDTINNVIACDSELPCWAMPFILENGHQNMNV